MSAQLNKWLGRLFTVIQIVGFVVFLVGCAEAYAFLHGHFGVYIFSAMQHIVFGGGAAVIATAGNFECRLNELGHVVNGHAEWQEEANQDMDTLWDEVMVDKTEAVEEETRNEMQPPLGKNGVDVEEYIAGMDFGTQPSITMICVYKRDTGELIRVLPASDFASPNVAVREDDGHIGM